MSRLLFWMWVVLAIMDAFLICQPIGLAGQATLCISVIGLLAVIWLLRLDGMWRHVFLAFASVVILRYAFWRTTSTLPPVGDMMSFIPGIILYVAEMYCILMLGISLFVVSDPKQRGPAPKVKDADAPTVDVFVPSYNEGANILALTLAAAKAMDYPVDRFTVYLLDDGATTEKLNSQKPEAAWAAARRAVEMKDLCARLGVTYLARERNEHAKAGNLNAGLAVSRGELVVVFDADHAPERRFLQETVGFFGEDPRLFLVQTPHFFSNPDPIERNLGTFRNMPSENEMFYGKIQKGLDRWDASFFCGSAAVLRRAALEEAGGFSGITITEDCETALELHGRGWHSAYVDKPMISGLQPETLAGFIGQRSRWCRGMVQILLLKNPLFRPGLSVPQRISYLSNSLFWLFPFARSVFFVAPLLFILFNLKIYVSSLEEFAAYTLSYLIVSEMIRGYLYGSVRWPWVSELYEYVQSVYLGRAIVSVLLSPRRPTFNVTAKGETIDVDRLSELALPYFIIFGVFCASMFMCVYRYQTEPEIGGLLAVAGIWQFMNLIFAGAALGVVTERRERRQTPRIPVHRKIQLMVGGTLVPATIGDISMTGALVYPLEPLPADIRPGQTATLQLVDGPEALRNDRVPVTLVQGASSRAQDIGIGIHFVLSHEDYRVLAYLMLDDMELVRRQRMSRQRATGMTRASGRMIGWALLSPFRAMRIGLVGRRDEKLAVLGHGAKDAARSSDTRDVA